MTVVGLTMPDRDVFPRLARSLAAQTTAVMPVSLRAVRLRGGQVQAGAWSRSVMSAAVVSGVPISTRLAAGYKSSRACVVGGRGSQDHPGTVPPGDVRTTEMHSHSRVMGVLSAAATEGDACLAVLNVR